MRMNVSFDQKLAQCKDVIRECLAPHVQDKSGLDWDLTLAHFFSDVKFDNMQSFSELWRCYGLTDENLKSLGVPTQSYTTLFHMRFSALDQWFLILFYSKNIAFKAFFDMEIALHERLRKRATQCGITHLILYMKL